MERRTVTISGTRTTGFSFDLIVNYALKEWDDPKLMKFVISDWKRLKDIEKKLEYFTTWADEIFGVAGGVFIFAVDNANTYDKSDFIVIESDFIRCLYAGVGAICNRAFQIIGENESVNAYIFQVASFEDAYAIALNMRETHALCYDRNYTLN